MATLSGVKIRIGEVDVSSFVRSIQIATAGLAELNRSFSAIAGRFKMIYRGTLPPRTYRALTGRQHPRVSRMHAAYGRRRKGW